MAGRVILDNGDSGLTVFYQPGMQLRDETLKAALAKGNIKWRPLQVDLGGYFTAAGFHLRVLPSELPGGRSTRDADCSWITKRSSPSARRIPAARMADRWSRGRPQHPLGRGGTGRDRAVRYSRLLSQSRHQQFREPANRLFAARSRDAAAGQIQGRGRSFEQLAPRAVSRLPPPVCGGTRQSA